MSFSTPESQLVQAPASWRCIDFISDLHLDAGEPETFVAWQNYMAHTSAQAVFILGDLFEAWVGDDLITVVADVPASRDSLEQRCAQTLLRSSEQRDIFFMRGNRDFLVGEAFARACGVHLLGDPAVLVFAGQRWLLSHGDALCLADTEYMLFRAMVRSEAWQLNFMRQPLEQRRQEARGLRARSEARKRTHPAVADVDAHAAISWLRDADAHCLIHGHTHRPASHSLAAGLQRIVLSDWDMHATPARAEVLRIVADVDAGAAQVRRLQPASA